MNNRKNLLGISGRIKNGKDLVAGIIQFFTRYDKETTPDLDIITWMLHSNHQQVYMNYGRYEIKKYADSLKDIVCILIGCTREQLENREFKETELGEEWRVYYKIYTEGQLSRKTFITKKQYNILHKTNELGQGWEVNYYTEIYTPRKLMQVLGTECGRGIIHPNLWVNAMFSNYKSIKPKKYYDLMTDDFSNSWLVTDVRFPENEGVGITNRGGINIGVKRFFSLRYPEYKDLEDKKDPYKIPKELQMVNYKLYLTLTHESEELMGDFSWCDYVIENNGTIDELMEQVKSILIKEKII